MLITAETIPSNFLNCKRVCFFFFLSLKDGVNNLFNFKHRSIEKRIYLHNEYNSWNNRLKNKPTLACQPETTQNNNSDGLLIVCNDNHLHVIRMRKIWLQCRKSSHFWYYLSDIVIISSLVFCMEFALFARALNGGSVSEKWRNAWTVLLVCVLSVLICSLRMPLN